MAFCFPPVLLPALGVGGWMGWSASRWDRSVFGRFSFQPALPPSCSLSLLRLVCGCANSSERDFTFVASIVQDFASHSSFIFSPCALSLPPTFWLKPTMTDTHTPQPHSHRSFGECKFSRQTLFKSIATQNKNQLPNKTMQQTGEGGGWMVNSRRWWKWKSSLQGGSHTHWLVFFSWLF